MFCNASFIPLSKQVGLVAAGLGAARVVLTDLPHLMPYVQRNAQVSWLILVRESSLMNCDVVNS
jgi:hypothetical protein